MSMASHYQAEIRKKSRTKKRKADHQKLVEEKAHCLVLEIDRDEKTKELEQAKGDIDRVYEMIQKQNEMIHKCSEDRIELLVKAEGVSELDSATVGRHKD